MNGKRRWIKLAALTMALMLLLSGCTLLRALTGGLDEGDTNPPEQLDPPDDSDPVQPPAVDPEPEPEPEPALSVNEDILALIGMSNGELKALLGTKCDTELYAGGMPAVYYSGISNGPYPYDFWLDGSYERAYEAWLDAPRDGEYSMPSSNPFPDDFGVMTVYLYRNYGVEDLFTGDAKLNYDTIGECLGQFPDTEFEPANQEGPFSSLVDFWYAGYDYEGYHIRIAYEKASDVLVPFSIEIWAAGMRETVYG